MTTASYEVAWTRKVDLSRRIQDPLGLYVLKYLEDDYLSGITTQTQRLRYYSFLTWIWREIQERYDHWAEGRSQVLSAEKILSLAAALHHRNDPEPPGGIRNRQDATDFLASNRTLRLTDFVRFGRNNKVGYGNFYYTGPLASLHILWRKDDASEVVFSPVGIDIANAFIHNADADVFFQESVKRADLAKLYRCCFCAEQIPKEEIDLWRSVFFGFTAMRADGTIAEDKSLLKSFFDGSLKIPSSFSVAARISEEDYLRGDTLDTLSVALSQDAQEIERRKLARRYTLLLVMKILGYATPNADPFWELNQTIRDAIYFSQILSERNVITRLNFGSLDSLRAIWEVYVHNLYFISVFEYIFNILLVGIQSRPFGLTLEDVLSKLEETPLIGYLSNWFQVSDLSTTVHEAQSLSKHQLPSGRSDLSAKLNERNVFLAMQVANGPEEVLGCAVALLILLKNRFEAFSDDQLKVIASIEARTAFVVRPDALYPKIDGLSLRTLVSFLVRDVTNRHKFVASMKYGKFGTKSWLFTEEEGLLYHYGRDYRARAYREAKWWNVVELLYDMGLVSYDNGKVSLTAEGKDWVNRIP